MSKKTVLITGASSGIGNATARTLIGEGFAVYVAARRVEKMKDLEDLGCIPLKMDITNDEDVVNVVERIKREQGGVDILINNAGFSVQGSVEETALEDARYQFDVNLFGLARLTQLVVPTMRANRFGKIINITSIGGKIYAPMAAWYIATKHALEGWSDCLRLELAPFDIDVIIVEPGAIATEFDDVALEPMLRRSGEGPYREMAQGIASFQRDLGERPDGHSPPSVIAETILKAISAARPKTRYVAGKMAKPMLLARRWLSDRGFDRMVTSMIR